MNFLRRFSVAIVLPAIQKPVINVHSRHHHPTYNLKALVFDCVIEMVNIDHVEWLKWLILTTCLVFAKKIAVVDFNHFNLKIALFFF